MRISWVRRYIKEGRLKSEKREGKIYLDKGELTALFSKKMRIPIAVEQPKDNQIITHLEKENNEMKERIRQLENENLKLRDKIDALQEEIKGLLRVQHGKSKGIMGYIVDKVWRG